MIMALSKMYNREKIVNKKIYKKKKNQIVWFEIKMEISKYEINL